MTDFSPFAEAIAILVGSLRPRRNFHFFDRRIWTRTRSIQCPAQREGRERGTEKKREREREMVGPT